MAAHQFWRVELQATSGSTVFSLSGFELFVGTGGGATLVTGSGTASATQTNGVNVASNPINNTGTAIQWLSNDSTLQYFYYNFGLGNDFDITRIGMAPSASPSQFPASWELQYSDDGGTYFPYFGHFSGTPVAGVYQFFDFADTAAYVDGIVTENLIDATTNAVVSGITGEVLTSESSATTNAKVAGIVVETITDYTSLVTSVGVVVEVLASIRDVTPIAPGGWVSVVGGFA